MYVMPTIREFCCLSYGLLHEYSFGAQKNIMASRHIYVLALGAIVLTLFFVIPAAATPPDVLLPDGGKYYGNLKDGLLHGQGKIEYENGAYYEGNFEAGYMDGDGKFVYAGGTTYEGEFRNGVIEGKGTYTTAQGDSYTGDFVRDQLTGQASISLPEQSLSYEGEVKNWEYHGFGVLESPDGTYEGDFKDGLYHGKGQFSYANGARYEGEFAHGEMHGKGRFESEGAVYEGQFVEGAFTGKGTFSSPDGMSYAGAFEHWSYQGDGVMTDAEGNTYAGKFEYGRLSGKAKYNGVDGSAYEGEFYNQQYHGLGHLSLADGTEYEGRFSRGKYQGKGKLSSPVGNDETKTIEGIWEQGVLVFDNTSKDYKDSQVELALENHQRLLSSEISELATGNADTIDAYFLGFAGDGTQGVFQRELEFIQSYFDTHLKTADRSINLINGHETAGQYPLATARSLKTSIDAIASKMNLEQDILFMYLSSHGSREHDLLVDHDDIKLRNLSAEFLKNTVIESGIKWKVIFVSACFSGGMIPYLNDPYTIVLTAADAESQSFGCSDDSDMTYFGKALFKETLAKQPTLGFEEAFENAKKLITEWENEKEYKHSNPQISKPKEILTYLRQWQRKNASR